MFQIHVHLWSFIVIITQLTSLSFTLFTSRSGQTHGVGWGTRNYHNGNGNGAAKRKGEQTDTGDYNMLVAEHLSKTAADPHRMQLDEFIPRWKTSMKSWRSWMCTQVLEQRFLTIFVCYSCCSCSCWCGFIDKLLFYWRTSTESWRFWVCTQVIVQKHVSHFLCISSSVFLCSGHWRVFSLPDEKHANQTWWPCMCTPVRYVATPFDVILRCTWAGTITNVTNILQ
jgi:hypothetical protein